MPQLGQFYDMSYDYNVGSILGMDPGGDSSQMDSSHDTGEEYMTFNFPQDPTQQTQQTTQQTGASTLDWFKNIGGFLTGLVSAGAPIAQSYLTGQNSGYQAITPYGSGNYYQPNPEGALASLQSMLTSLTKQSTVQSIQSQIGQVAAAAGQALSSTSQAVNQAVQSVSLENQILSMVKKYWWVAPAAWAAYKLLEK